MDVEEDAWRTESLDLIVLDLLRKREGTIKEDELLEMLKAMIKDFCASELNKALLGLELRGKINVATHKKGRIITLLKPRGGGQS
jgi:hypothetical protein